MAQHTFDAGALADNLSAVPAGFTVNTNWDSSISVLQANASDLTNSNWHGWAVAGGEIVSQLVELRTGGPPPTLTQGNIDDVSQWGISWDAPGSVSGDFDLVVRMRFGDALGVSFWGNHYVKLEQASDLTYIATYNIGYSSPTQEDNFNFDPQFDYDGLGKILFVRIKADGSNIDVTFWREGEAESTRIRLSDTVTAGSGVFGFWSGNNAVQAGFSHIWLGTGADSAPFPNTTPSTPTVSAGTPDASGNVVLTSSAYSGTEDHGHTHWQIDLQSGDFSDPVVDRRESGHLTSLNVPSLPVGDYQTRIRHVDVLLGESSWSSAVNFSVTSRDNPQLVQVLPLLGNLIGVYDLANNKRYGIDPSTGMPVGGAQGGRSPFIVWRPELGRYGRLMRYFGGVSTLPDPDVVSGGQSGERTAFGFDAAGFLGSASPGINKKFIIRDRVSLTSAQTVGAIRMFWGMHLASLPGPVITGNNEAAIGFLAIGQNLEDPGNWFALATDHDGNTVYRNVDSGVPSTQFNDMRIEADGLTKRVEWYINDNLVTSLIWPDDMSESEWDRLGTHMQARIAGQFGTFFDIVHVTGIAERQYQMDIED